MAIETAIILRAVNKASGVIGEVQGDLEGLNNQSFGGLTSNLAAVGKVLSGLVLGGVVAVGTALGAGALEGLRFNSSMEQVSAQLMAFLKDGDKVDATLEMITQRAAATPFAFEAMAKAATGLIPAATQANVPLEKLLETAEVLAASNPAEGLEGAAFALREAVSGDFTSIIERFNLPRSYINQLKDEGVPALEAVQMAMASLGLDTQLVTNLAGTFEGRWSTVKDTFTVIAAQLTEPLFDVMSESMGGFLDTLNTFQPIIDGVVEGLSKFFGNLLGGEKPLDSVLILVSDLGRTLGYNVREIKAFNDKLKTFYDQTILAKDGVMEFITPIGEFLTKYVTMKDILISAGIAIAAFVIPALASLIVTLAPIILAIAAVVAAVVLFRMAWEENFLGIQQVVQGFAEFFGQISEGFQQLFGGDTEAAMATFGAAFTTLGEAVTLALTNIYTAVSAWASTVDWAAIGSAIVDALLMAFSFIATTVGTYLVGLYTGIVEWIAGIDWAAVWYGITQWYANAYIGLFEKVVPYLTELIASLTAWVSEQDWEAIGYTLTTMLLEGIKTLWDETSAFLGEFWTNVQTFFTDTDWKQLGTTVSTNTSAGLSALWTKAKAKFDAMYESIKGWFADTNWSDLTTDLISGLIAGIAAGVSSVVQAAADLASGVAQAIADVWDSNSPSKWAINKAMTIGQGMVIGLDNSQAPAEMAGADLGQAVTGGVNAGLAAGVQDNRQTVYNQTWNVNTNSLDSGRESMAAWAFNGGI